MFYEGVPASRSFSGYVWNGHAFYYKRMFFEELGRVTLW